MKLDRLLLGVGVVLLADLALAQAPAAPPPAPAAAPPAAAPPAAAPAEAAPAPAPVDPGAQPAAPAEAAPAEPGVTDPAAGPSGVGDVNAAFHGEDVKDAFVAGSPVEQAGKTYYFVGARYRGIIVPKFEMNLFGDGGRTVFVHGVGPEFAIRRDDFEYQFSLWWAGYKMDETAFKASSDPDRAWEIVSSEINVINATAEFIWSYPLSPEFAINYGAGVGLGVVFGDLFRTQAYEPRVGAAIDSDNLVKCTSEAVSQELDPGDYCGDDNDHYNGYTEPSWADGGSKPIVFPWLSGQFGLRYKPHQNFVVRLDAGIGITGAFFGAGLDYGL